MNRKMRRVKEWVLNKNRSYRRKLPDQKTIDELDKMRVYFELQEKYPLNTKLSTNLGIMYVCGWHHEGVLFRDIESKESIWDATKHPDKKIIIVRLNELNRLVKNEIDGIYYT